MSELRTFFAPRTVAVVVASGTPGKWGYNILRTLLDGGYAGEIVAINGRGGEVQGVPAVRSAADLPWEPDLALVAVGRDAAVVAVEELAERGCRNVVVHTAGFAETGADGAVLQSRMLAAANATGMRILGPNCMNLFVAASRLNLTGISNLPSGKPGHLAFIAQSGNLVYDLIEYNRRSRVGLSAFVSLGNQADLGVEDLLDWFADDPNTDGVALYLENVRPGRGRVFLEAAHHLARLKPVVALLGGTTATGRRSALSHTASMLTDARELRGFLRQAGVIEVERLDELFPVADALLACPVPNKRTVALCGGGGGHATVASDALSRKGVELPWLSAGTQKKLRAIFPPMASVTNPVDWVGASERSFWAYRDSAQQLLADPGIGGVILYGHFGGYLTESETPENNYRDVAAALGELQRTTGKPILLHSIYAQQDRDSFDALWDAGIPLFGSLEHAAVAYSALADRASIVARGPLPIEYPDDDDIELVAQIARDDGRTVLLEPEAMLLLAMHMRPYPYFRHVMTSDQARTFAHKRRRPIALKLVSDVILHKSDVGGVKLNLMTEDDAERSFEELQAVALAQGVPFRGALAVDMTAPGIDVALGMAHSELGGHVMLFGSGGTDIEVLDDVSVRPAPIDRDDARAMVSETLAGRLLANPRGMKPPSLEPLYDLMVRISIAIAGSEYIQELDLNPVRVTRRGAIVLDARVVLTDADPTDG